MSLDKVSVVVHTNTEDTPIEYFQEVCSSIGEVAQIVLRRDSKGKLTGGAFVIYKHEDDALQAAMHLSGEKLQVQHVGPEIKQEFDQLLDEDAAQEQFMKAYRKLTPRRKMQAISELCTEREMGMSAEYNSSPFAAPNIDTPKLTTGLKLKNAATSESARSRLGTTTSQTPVVPAREQIVTPVWHEVPRLSSFSGFDGFDRWNYEVMCLIRENHSQSTIMATIRKSLKSPAADVLRRLGDKVTIDQVLSKFQSLYGTILSGDVLLQKFFGEEQREKESCVEWSCRLEHYLFEAIEQGVASKDLAKKLSSRFWNGLVDERVRNALRHVNLPFEELVVEARRVEEEYGARKKMTATENKPRVRAQQVDNEVDVLLDRLLKLEHEMAEMKAEGSTQNFNLQSQKIACHKCQQVGHLSFGCRDQSVVCYKCRKAGHIANACLN